MILVFIDTKILEILIKRFKVLRVTWQKVKREKRKLDNKIWGFVKKWKVERINNKVKVRNLTKGKTP